MNYELIERRMTLKEVRERYDAKCSCGGASEGIYKSPDKSVPICRKCLSVQWVDEVGHEWAEYRVMPNITYDIKLKKFSWNYC